MSMLNGFIVAAALAASTTAVARPAQLTDTQYLAVARCRALIASPALGKQDTSAIDAEYKAQSLGRMPVALDRADEVQSDASRAGGEDLAGAVPLGDQPGLLVALGPAGGAGSVGLDLVGATAGHRHAAQALGLVLGVDGAGVLLAQRGRGDQGAAAGDREILGVGELGRPGDRRGGSRQRGGDDETIEHGHIPFLLGVWMTGSMGRPAPLVQLNIV